MSNMGEGPLARFRRVNRPVAREEGLLIEQLSDETVVYDSEWKEAHCLSPLAAVVFEHCDGHTTVEKLATLASERLGEPVDESGVINALDQLQERRLLAVPPVEGLSRRQMIGKTAAAAGAFAGASLITTIAAPGAIAASGGSATCGVVTCCPCCAGGNNCSDFNKGPCCDAPGTINCQCGANDSRTAGTIGTGVTCGKYCKPGGNNYFTAQLCDSLYQPSPDTPAAQAFRNACVGGQSFPGGGACNCTTCNPANGGTSCLPVPATATP